MILDLQTTGPVLVYDMTKGHALVPRVLYAEVNPDNGAGALCVAPAPLTANADGDVVTRFLSFDYAEFLPGQNGGAGALHCYGLPE